MPTASLDWVDRALKKSHSDPGVLRRLGTANIQVAFRSGQSVSVVKFEDFDVSASDRDKETELVDADVTVSMTPRQWNAYIQQRKRGAGLSLQALDLSRGALEFRSPLTRATFLRVHQSVQEFIDIGAVES